MFTVDETFFAGSFYLRQKDLYWRAVTLVLGVFFIVEYIRVQVPEIEVLQLIPGLYLLLLFLSWIFLVFVSTIFQRFPLDIDNKKSAGTKTILRMELGSIGNSSVVLTMMQLAINLNTVIPISLDSFNYYGEKTLENLWSLEEIIGLEAYLLFVIVILAQVPVIALLSFGSESYALLLPTVWRAVGVICVTIGGIVTPTIDVVTQLSFALSTFFLYTILIYIVLQRMNVKYKEINSLS